MVKNITFNDGNSIPQLGYGVWQIEDNGAADAVGTALEAGYRHNRYCIHLWERGWGRSWYCRQLRAARGYFSHHQAVELGSGF